jgi:hypothetical protein
MEPTGIEPVTSCLQSAREGGRLRVGCGYLAVDAALSPRFADLPGSDPGG